MVIRKTRKNRAQFQPTGGPKRAFGLTLREAREAKGLSQEQLATAAGLDRSFISLVERGIQCPNIAVLLQVAQVLGVSAAEMIAKTESRLKADSTEQ